jgi:hypothetical protein
MIRPMYWRVGPGWLAMVRTTRDHGPLATRRGEKRLPGAPRAPVGQQQWSLQVWPLLPTAGHQTYPHCHADAVQALVDAPRVLYRLGSEKCTKTRNSK